MRLYDIAQSPSVLLATFTGTSLPPTATYYTGQLVVVFTSTPSSSAQGWDAFYSTVISGVDRNDLENTLNIFPNPPDNNLISEIFFTKKLIKN